MSIRAHLTAAWRPLPAGVIPSAHSGSVRRGSQINEKLVRDVWLEAAVDDHWHVAYRLGWDGRRLVISELRVFPREARRAGVAVRGEWSGTYDGLLARGIPPGGIGARTLRRVRLAVHERALATALGAKPTALLAEWIKDGVPPAPVPVTSRPTRAGRPPLPRSFYARLAARYVEAVSADESPHPVVDVATAMGLSVSRVRSALHRARQMGLLTHTRPGAKGGLLTPAARRLLR